MNKIFGQTVVEYALVLFLFSMGFFISRESVFVALVESFMNKYQSVVSVVVKP